MFNLKDGFGDDGVVDTLKSQLNHDWGWRNFYSPLDPHHPAPTVPMISFSDHEPYFLSLLLGGCASEFIPCGVQVGFVCALPREAGRGKLGSWGQGCLGACDQIFCLATGGIHHWLLDLEGGPPGGERLAPRKLGLSWVRFLQPHCVVNCLSTTTTPVSTLGPSLPTQWAPNA